MRAAFFMMELLILLLSLKIPEFACRVKPIGLKEAAKKGSVVARRE
jgi:hypothetical protein